MTQPTACPSCGAKWPAGAERCDLCGTSLNDLVREEPDAPDVFTEEPVAAQPVFKEEEVGPSVEPVVCETCSHVNPARSRFCNQCGTFLAEHVQGTSSTDVPVHAPVTPQKVKSDAASDRPPSDVGRRALWMVGLAVGTVILLYGLTVLSNRGSTPAPSQENVGSVPAETGSTVLPDSLQVLASALEAEGTASGWAQLGHLYFTSAMQADEAARAEYARRAVDAFDLSLGIEENADVRTSLAEAAQFDPRNPMRAVQELQSVLATTPDHVAANYLLGALRARIGRLDGAAESFQKVIDLTPPEDPIHQRAVEDLAAVEQAISSSPSGQ